MGQVFENMKNTAVLTTREVLEEGSPILLVARDKEDGMWQFLPGNDVKTENAKLVALSEVLSVDESLNQLEDLLLGWKATRRSVEDEWVRVESI